MTPRLHDIAWAAWFAGERPHARRSVPAELRAVAEEVARYAETTGRDVERLRALLLVDQELARASFDTAFRECDQRFDLTACANLIARAP